MMPLMRLALLLLCLPFTALATEAPPWFVTEKTETLRAGPATHHPAVARAEPGQRLRLTREVRTWAGVENEATGLFGWLPRKALRPWLAPSPDPVAAPTPMPTPVAVPAPEAVPAAIVSNPPVAVVAAVKPAQETKPAPVAAIAPPPVVILPKPERLAMREIRLRMDALDAEVLFRKEPYDRSYFNVQVEAAEGLLPGDIEVKGSSTRLLAKRGLNIKLKSGLWHGQRRLSLDATASDPSRVRQWTAWRLFADLGLAAPEVNFTRVYINDRYYGPYLHIEWIDTGLMARRGLGGDGQLFQPDDIEMCGNFSASNAPRLKECWNKLAPRDGKLDTLIDLDQAIRATPAETYDRFIDERFESESLINWMVVNLLVNDNDTYNKNYFLYQAASGRWSAIPWDYDLTFGRAFDPDLTWPASIYNDNFQYNSTPELGAPNPLKEKVLRNPALRARYMARVKHLLGLERDPKATQASFAWFTPEAMEARFSDIERGLAEDVSHDPFMGDVAQFRQHLDGLLYYVNVRRALLKEKLFGAYPWSAETAIWDPALLPPPQPLPTALNASLRIPVGVQRATVADNAHAYALVSLTRANADTALDLTLSAEMNQAPQYLPPGFVAEQCAQRSWLLGLSTPGVKAQVDLRFEYLHETSKRNELGARMNEAGQQLWMSGPQGWQAVATQANPVVNTLLAQGFTLESGRYYRFVACGPLAEPPPPATAKTP